MSHHTNPASLSELPFPLLPSKDQAGTALGYIARLQADLSATTPPASFKPLGPEVIARNRSLIFTAESEGLTQQEFNALVQEENLVHFHHGVYIPAKAAHTPLLRALSCDILLPPGLSHRTRFSRRTAAWLLGFGELPETQLNIDYDRVNRIHLSAAAKPYFSAHQVSFSPYDSLAIGDVKLTNHLRTCLDLIIHDRDYETNEIVLTILLSPFNPVTPELFFKSLEETRFIKHRASILEQARTICTEAKLRQEDLW